MPLRVWVAAHPDDEIAVFVSVVVLNLAFQYLPTVISETFTLSLVTSMLLKVTQELVLVPKGAVLTRLREAPTRLAKTISALMLWVVAAGSKLVVVWLVDVTFGGSVSLGGFIPVTLLVLALWVSRAAVRRLLYGTTDPDRNPLALPDANQPHCGLPADEYTLAIGRSPALKPGRTPTACDRGGFPTSGRITNSAETGGRSSIGRELVWPCASPTPRCLRASRGSVAVPRPSRLWPPTGSCLQPRLPSW
jgi:hypothetical protein